MNNKIMSAVIGAAAVIIFFIWGSVEGNYDHAWIVFLAAAVANLAVTGKLPPKIPGVTDKDDPMSGENKPEVKADEPIDKTGGAE